MTWQCVCSTELPGNGEIQCRNFQKQLKGRHCDLKFAKVLLLRTTYFDFCTNTYLLFNSVWAVKWIWILRGGHYSVLPCHPVAGKAQTCSVWQSTGSCAGCSSCTQPRGKALGASGGEELPTAAGAFHSTRGSQTHQSQPRLSFPM